MNLKRFCRCDPPIRGCRTCADNLRKRICPDCDGPKPPGKPLCRHCGIAARKGTESTEPCLATGHVKARALIPKGAPCEECGAPDARDRHHVDDDPNNNDPANVMALCRRCHMLIDGRLERLIQRNKERAA